ncbi:MAG: nitronate monooxygenase family protein [Burkholderiaceae bacterium]
MSHPIVTSLYQQTTLPVIAAPMFIVSGPELVVAQCASGIVGSMPALNARPQSQLAEWLAQIEETLIALRNQDPSAVISPYAINHIIHASNKRLDADLEVCARFKVPYIISSLRAPDDVVKTIHGWGGKVFHDVTTLRHAEKALEAGVDGLILVCAGAGGHAGTVSPFALLNEVRRFFDGPVTLAGAITHGHDVLAALAMGADFAYMGTRFIASEEARAIADHKQMILDARSSDIVYTPYFSGIPANYLRASITAAGYDPDDLPKQKREIDAGTNDEAKAWRDVWSAGQGAGSIQAVLPTSRIVQELRDEYHARAALLSEAIPALAGIS